MTSFDPAAWAAKVRGEDCPVCREHVAPPSRTANSGAAPATGPAGALPPSPLLVAELPSGRVILQDDAAFRGYCILFFRRHATELTDLSPAEQTQLMADVARVARAIGTCCRPAKLNYAILGNEVPHLHVHVIARYPDDGWWGRPIWLRPAGERRGLSEGVRAELVAELREALR